MSQADRCSFCNRPIDTLPMVVRSQVTECIICTDCIAQCVTVMADQMKQPKQP
jgi:hypothetical protein